MSEGTFGTWTVPESPVDIEYSMLVIDEIRQAVSEGFQRLSRGGIEVGGVLYGTVVGRRLRIMAVREIACEHARGPTFHLSNNDHELLNAQLEREREDPRLSGMVPVGWYLSHTRSEITLQASDLDTYSRFFPQPWQVTMVIRPGRSQSMRAGFFVREADGTVKTDQSYYDFPFPDRLPGMGGERPPRERPAGQERRGAPRPDPGADLQSLAEELAPREPSEFRAPIRQEPEVAPYTPPRSQSGLFASPETPPGLHPVAKRKFPWVIVAVVVVGVVLAVLGLRYLAPRPNADPIGLALSERDGQLRIQWNQGSRTILAASHAVIEITDGNGPNDKQQVNLTASQLASGGITYMRKTGDVQIRMDVTGGAGAVEEGSRFLGGAPDAVAAAPAVVTPPAPDPAATAEHDAQIQELTRLRALNAQQADRIQRLERTMTILRSRLGIADPAQ